MPSTPSERLLAEKQAAGENLNTWGLRLNTVIDMIDAALRGRAEVTVDGSAAVTGSNYTLTDDSCAFLDLSGSGGTLTIPGRESVRLVRNGCAGPVTVTTGSGALAVLGGSEVNLIACDGTNVRQLGAGGLSWKAYADSLAFAALNGDLPGQTGNAGLALTTDGSAASWGQLPQSTIAGLPAALSLLAPLASPAFSGDASFAAGYSLEGTAKSNEVNLSGVAEIDVSSAHFFRDTISSSKTYTFAGETGGEAEAFVLTLTITSGANPDFPASVEWPGGSEPTFSDGKHQIGFVKSNDVWSGRILASGLS